MTLYKGEPILNEYIPIISHKNSILLNRIRIFATWSVLLGHGFSYCQITIFKDQTHFAYIQNWGVVLLIMLSGFLTAYSLDKKRSLPNYDYRHFLIDKFCRIIIPFIPAISFVALLDKISMTLQPDKYEYYDAYNLKTFIGNILQLQDVPKPNIFVTSFGSSRQFWTLSVEWWFYLLAGFIVLYFYPRLKVKSLTIMHILILSALSIPSIFHLVGGCGNGLTFTYGLGIIIYYLHNKFKTKEKRLLYLAILTSSLSIIACGICFKDAYNNIFVLCTGLSFLFCLILGNCVDTKSIKKANSFFANYTYSLYLLHYSIMVFLYCTTTLQSYSRFFVSIILSNIIAIIFYFLFEKNTNKISHKLKNLLT